MRMSSRRAAVTLLSAVLAVVVDGHLDLFMNETETKRLLGELRLRYFRAAPTGQSKT